MKKTFATKKEFLEACNQALTELGDNCCITRYITDTRYDYHSEDIWYLAYMNEESLGNLYEQYIDAPMFKVYYSFASHVECSL